jgi:hypothetical protein
VFSAAKTARGPNPVRVSSSTDVPGIEAITRR